MRFAPSLKLCGHTKLNEYLNGKFVSPINVEVSVSGVCNADCPWCFYRNKQDNTLIDRDVLINFLYEAKEKAVEAITWTGGGEPTLHPDFPDFVEILYEIGISQGLITNGLNNKIEYNPKLFQWIRVSKTNRAWNIENLSALRASCKTIGLCINYIGNAEEVEEALKIAGELNIDYVQVRPALRGKGKKTFTSPPAIKHRLLTITDYKFEDARKDKIYTKCEGYHFVPFIWQDGDVDVCAYHRGNPEFNLGNIYKQSFYEIMKNAPSFVEVQKDCQICCKNDQINMLIYDIRNLEDRDFV